MKSKIFHNFFKTLFLFLLMSATACKKELPVSTPVLEQQFTTKTWFYYEYFTNYSLPTSNLVYKFDKTDNTLDLSLLRFKFKSDNTFEETSKDVVIKKGTWKYVNTTQVIVSDNSGVEIFTIPALSDGFLHGTIKKRILSAPCYRNNVFS